MSASTQSQNEPTWNVPVEPEKPFMFSMTVPIISQFIFPQSRLPYANKIFTKLGISNTFLSSTTIFNTKYINNALLLRCGIGCGLLFAGFKVIAAAVSGMEYPQENQNQTEGGNDTVSTPGNTEKAKLSTDGIFKYLRHPIYAGSILMQLGVSIMFDNGAVGIISALYFTWLQAIVLPIEEKGLQQFFGEPYKKYMKQTKRWYFF